MAKPINLTAELKDVSARGKTGQKFAVQIESTELMFDPNDKVMAAEVAEALRVQFVEMLRLGRRADGTALPSLTGASLEWRQVEAAQGARGGAAHDRYIDPKVRARVRDNYDRDYTTKRSGKGYVPAAGGPRGNVSGLLADSVFARPNRDGKGVTLYVAAQRGKPRRGETMSALQSVFGHGDPIPATALATPAVLKAIQAATEKMLHTSAASLAKALAETIENLNDIAEETTDE